MMMCLFKTLQMVSPIESCGTHLIQHFAIFSAAAVGRLHVNNIQQWTCDFESLSARKRFYRAKILREIENEMLRAADSFWKDLASMLL